MASMPYYKLLPNNNLQAEYGNIIRAANHAKQQYSYSTSKT